MDARNDLINEISVFLADKAMDARSIQEWLYIKLNDYEISSRCTDVALVKEDRNKFLLGKFMIAKTVKGCTERTLEYYKHTLNFVFERIPKTIDDITADDVRLYIAIRRKRDGITDVTADDELRVLRSFFNYLQTEELIVKNPIAKIDCIKTERCQKEALAEEEIEKLRFAAAKGFKTRQKYDFAERNVLIVELLLSTGVRVSELVKIKLNEIRDKRILVHGKGRKDRYVYMSVKAQFALERYLPKRKDLESPYLFPGDENGHIGKCTVSSITRKIARTAGVERANPHKFRRTCATMALRRGMPIEQVSKMLGHEQISTTQIYLDLSEEDLAYAHSKYVV